MSRHSLPLRHFVPHVLAIVFAAAACFSVAIWAQTKIEDRALEDIRLVLGQAGHDWSEVAVDGLQVTLFGVAPNEATRFAALSLAGTIVDASRIRDEMTVQAVDAIALPAFSVEILKNDDGLSLIGLVPAASNPEDIVERARSNAGSARVTDLLESADFAPPAGWSRALDFGLTTLSILPRSKISISPSEVAITAVAKDAEDKSRIERRLRREVPGNVRLIMNVSAPRPVIAPFTLRLVIDDQGARFDACSADSDSARRAIIEAARATGMTGDIDCTLGLGSPSSQWGEAAAMSIRALADIGKGTLTLSNADISIIASEGTAPDVFERTIGELESQLPDVFSLAANRLVPEARERLDPTAPEFVATRSPEGLVQMRGRLGDELTRDAVESFAVAQFGVANVYPAMRVTEGVPAGWPTRVLSALEALAILNNGSVIVTPEAVEVSGKSGRKDARAEITRILSSKLPTGSTFNLDVSYSEALDPLAALPTPEECVERINTAAAEHKITFAPSSTDIEDDALKTIDAISEILRDCQTVQIEIGGHTDSQGREVMNEQLSQARADSVLNAIMARRVLTSNLTAKGYGETQPIADNDSEEGREANRRIEFKLVVPDDSEEPAEATSDAPEPDQDKEKVE